MTDDSVDRGALLVDVPSVDDPVRVLHVDDQSQSRRLVATSLEDADVDADLTVSTETDPGAVLDRLATDAVDCVVSGYRMPSMDGLELLRAVRADHPDLPFVLFTGEGSEEIASEAIDTGVSAYVQKDGPDAYDRLANRIVEAVRRHRAERRARVARTRLLDLYERTDAFYIVDDDWRIVYWNDRIADRTGHDPGDVLGESLWTVFPEAVVTELYDYFQTAMETGESVEFETYYDPDDYWLEVRVHPIDEGLFVHSRDVTAEKERAREDVLDRMGDAFFAVDDEWHLTYLNDRARQILARAMGRSPDATHLEGRHLWEEIPEAVDTTFHEKYHEAMDTQEDVSFEAYFGPLNTWFEVNAYPSETGLSVYFRDVTEARRRRDALETRERVLREMQAIVADRDRSFAEQVEALLDLGREELGVAYGALSEIRGDEYVFEVVAAAADSVEAGDVVPVSATNCERVVSTEETLVLGDVARDAPEETDRAGYTEWGIECYLGAPVYLDDAVRGTFCFYDTEPRPDGFSEWEVTLVDLMSQWVGYELQRQRVTERLQRQNAKLDRFASVVSHDLRNPLNSLAGWLDLAEETGDVEPFERCRRAVERMEALVDDLLVLARAGEGIDERTDIALGAAVEDCWRMVAADGATLRVDTERTIRGDDTRVRQLLENLVRNAVEHGGEDVTVRIGDLPDGFYLEDDGPGIPAGEREAAFESGYSTADGGTGVGLTIVREIVDAHGWDVRVTESDDGGARFEITGVDAGRARSTGDEPTDAA